MSVSAPTTQMDPNEDLAAVVAGGKHFVARLQILKDAKAEHDEALNNLRIGHDAIRAMQDVQRREQAVIDAQKAAEDEIAQKMEAARKDADGIVAAAKAEAEAIRAKGAADGDALAREVDNAHAALTAWSAATRSDANNVMDEAVNLRNAAKEKFEEAEKLHAAASQANAEANAKLEHFNAKLAAIRDWLARHRAMVDDLSSLT